MSNHFSAAYLKFPGGDAQLDLTDLFVFTSSASPGRTVLIIDVNPFMMGLNAVPPFLMKPELHPAARPIGPARPGRGGDKRRVRWPSREENRT